MCSMCDKKHYVELEKYGIGQEILFPGLTDLQVIDLEDPYYYLNVDGERLYLENVKILETAKFISGGMYETIKKQTTNIKRKRLGYNNKIYYYIMQKFTETCRGITKQKINYKNHLEEFCLNRQVSTDKNDLKKRWCVDIGWLSPFCI